MRKNRRILLVGIVFAVLLASTTFACISVLTTISAESIEVNRDVVQGTSTYYLYVNGSFYGGHADLFKVNATAVFPGAIVEYNYNFLMNVSFAMMLPANASFFSAQNLLVAFSPVPNPNLEFNRSVAYGSTLFSPGQGVGVNGEPIGTRIGLWNVTMFMGILWPPTVPWMEFTGQAETHLYMFLEGYGIMTAANGTNYMYYLYASFNSQGSPVTFYSFSYLLAVWLGCVGSIVIEVAWLDLLIHGPRADTPRAPRKKFDSVAVQ